VLPLVREVSLGEGVVVETPHGAVSATLAVHDLGRGEPAVADHAHLLGHVAVATNEYGLVGSEAVLGGEIDDAFRAKAPHIEHDLVDRRQRLDQLFPEAVDLGDAITRSGFQLGGVRRVLVHAPLGTVLVLEKQDSVVALFLPAVALAIDERVVRDHRYSHVLSFLGLKCAVFGQRKRPVNPALP